MKNKYLITVIIPCYNSEEYLKECLESVFNQKCDFIEIITINDGSTDSTLELLQNYKKNNSNMVIYSKPNGGYSTAVNKGLDLANGEYVMFLGSDDKLNDNIFNVLKEEIENTHPDMIGFITEKHFRENNITDLDSFTQFSNYIHYEGSAKELFDKYRNDVSIFFARDTSKIFRRDVVGETRYYGCKGYDADGIFSTQVSLKSKSFSILPIIGYEWFLREGSVSNQKMNLNIIEERLNNIFLFFSYLNHGNYDEPDFIKDIYYPSYKNLLRTTKLYKKHNKTLFKKAYKEVMLYSRRKNIVFSSKEKIIIKYPNLTRLLVRIKKFFK